jgi:hypothetical protein
MTTITYDTLLASKRLQERGVSAKQAEAIVQEISTAYDQNNAKYVTKIELNASNGELKAEISALRVEMAETKAEIIKWMFGGFVAIIGLLVAVLSKLS